MPLVPPFISTLPTAAASLTAYNAYLATADAYGLTPEQYWLGHIADQIILANKSGRRFVDIEAYMVTAANNTAITGAGYTVTPAYVTPPPITATVIPDQFRISW